MCFGGVDHNANEGKNTRYSLVKSSVCTVKNHIQVAHAHHVLSVQLAQATVAGDIAEAHATEVNNLYCLHW